MIRRVVPKIREEYSFRWLRTGAPGLIWRVSRVLGLAPFVFDGSRVRISRALSLYGKLFLAILNGIAILYTVIYDMSAKSNMQSQEIKSVTSKFVKKTDICMTTFISFSAIVFASHRMKSCIEVVKRVEKMKSKLDITNVNGKKETLIVASLLIFFIIFGCFDGYVRVNCANFHYVSLCVLGVVIRVLVYFTVVIIELQMIYTYWHITSVFPSFNSVLLQLIHTDYENHREEAIGFQQRFETNIASVTCRRNSELSRPVYRFATANTIISPLSRTEDIPPGIPKRTDKRRQLMLLNAIYTEVCELVDVVNHKHNGIATLLLITSYSIQSIASSYGVVVTLLQKPTPVLKLILLVLWTVHYIIMIYFITAPGHLIIQKIDETQRALNKVMGKALLHTDEMVVPLKMLAMKLMLIKPTFSPLNMCTLSRKLFVTIIWAAVTYVIIVVQFRSTEITELGSNNTTIF